MRIVDVRAVQPIAANSPPDWRTSFGQILVAVDTDCGMTGYGVGGGGAAAIHVVRTVLRDCLLERDPADIENLWNLQYQATLAFGRKGIAIMALSGVDLALWDLKGRAEQTPVAVLLGGNVNVSVPTYLTVWDELGPEDVVRANAFKLHLGKMEATGDLDAHVAAVQRARRLLGPEPELMIDAWMKWDLDSTLRFAERTAHERVSWIEEPVPIDQIEAYQELAVRCPIPIAGGEHEFTKYGFRDLIAQRLHRVLQPDVCWCGGLTQLIEIYRMANEAGLRVCPHRGAEVWALHALAALDPHPLAESGRPWMGWVGGQPQIINGSIQLTDAPGFGVEIDEAALPV